MRAPTVRTPTRRLGLGDSILLPLIPALSHSQADAPGKRRVEAAPGAQPGEGRTVREGRDPDPTSTGDEIGFYSGLSMQLCRPE